MKSLDWFVCPQPKSAARIRLICFPHAGGGAALFRDWPDLFASQIEIWVVNFPGHGARWQEPAYARMKPLIAELRSAIKPLSDKPFAFFGHSFGARIAFELAQGLRKIKRPLPTHLFLSACPAPQSLTRSLRLHTMPREALLTELGKRGGLPADVLTHPELLDALMPTLRADLAVLETAVYQPNPPLDIPIMVFGGTADTVVTPTELNAWYIQTKHDFRRQMFVGDHFYLKTAVAEVSKAINYDLGYTFSV